MIKVFKTDPRATVPSFATPGSAGFDLATLEDVIIYPGETALARTGLVIQAPAYHMLMIVPRSSTFKRYGLWLGNTVGIVDEDYCGPEDELKLYLSRDPKFGADNNQFSDILTGLFSPETASRIEQTYTIAAGTRLAQGIFVPVTRGEFEVVNEPIAANRGGWGSSGI
jgi:dUTP pyrophosphatase